MAKNILMAETSDRQVMMVEYDPLQFTFAAACLVMEDEFGITFIAYAALHVSDAGATYQLDSMRRTAQGTRQA